MGVDVTSVAGPSSDTNVATYKEKKASEERRAFGWIKLIGGITSAACFGIGIRAAVQQARPMKPNELSRPQLFGGVGFATRALLIATMVTVSGYGLLVVAVSAAFRVNSPRQFGDRMKEIFSDKYRLPGSTKKQEFGEIFKDS
ncbi:hypothetical protein DdX_11336 [Ditylenchus destructor]|uniref:Transmembrane protein 242 n=1 Tax=Ditylenchus destructor TaxID=166010 RepID=A0AAD4QY81_9BILA|nr:hypothetical protein DdX_11336 [Ditylenchus destructor]